MSQTFLLIITAAVAIGGKVITPNKPVEVDGKLAKNLLGRGRARLATEDEIAAYRAGQPAGPEPAGSEPQLDQADQVLADLLDNSIPKVAEALPELSDEQLARLRTLEEGGKTRRGVLNAIADEFERRAAEAADGDEASEADDSTDQAE